MKLEKNAKQQPKPGNDSCYRPLDTGQPSRVLPEINIDDPLIHRHLIWTNGEVFVEHWFYLKEKTLLSITQEKKKTLDDKTIYCWQGKERFLCLSHKDKIETTSDIQVNRENTFRSYRLERETNIDFIIDSHDTCEYSVYVQKIENLAGLWTRQCTRPWFR